MVTPTAEELHRVVSDPDFREKMRELAQRGREARLTQMRGNIRTLVGDTLSDEDVETLLIASLAAWSEMDNNVNNDDQESSLYFECHITIEPVFEERLEKAVEIGKAQGFSVADLLMQRRKEDTPERSKFDTFMTGRDKNRATLAMRMIATIFALKRDGFKVFRYKIEDTLLDSKGKDVLNILE